MRVGVIGTRWGLMHVGMFRFAGAEVVALCGRDAANTAAVAARERIAFATPDVRALCDRVDIVAIAGPDLLHAEHVRVALAAGRHVLCEKPLARDADDAQSLLPLAEEAAARGIVCATSFGYRYLPPLAALREQIRRRGAPRVLTVNVRNSFAGAEGLNDRRDGAIMGHRGDFGGASHYIDAMLWALGARATSVRAVFRGRPAHSLLFHLETDAGTAIDFVHVATTEPGIDGHWHAAGNGWDARFRAGYDPGRGGWCVGALEVSEGNGWDPIGAAQEPGAHVPEPWFLANAKLAVEFLSKVEGGAAPSLPSFADGARVQRLFAEAMAGGPSLA